MSVPTAALRRDDPQPVDRLTANGADHALLDHALSYAAGGFPVLPLHSPREAADGALVCDCRPDGRCLPDRPAPAKHPRTAHGLTDATTDEATIRRWWSMWPHANVGIAIPDGYVVVDVDVDAVNAALGDRELPPTATAKTGRGWQFLYRTAATVGPRVGILEHVDLRGPGSYVVAPPSRHINGATYIWVAPPHEGVAEAPPWVYDAGAGRRAGPTAPGSPIVEGQRNASLTRTAGAMRRHGMTVDEMTPALLAVNAGRCQPPLSDTEVRAIAASVGRYRPEPDVTIQATRVLPPGIDAADLLELELPALRMIVPDILPEGTTVIATPPKIGKSSFVYQLGVEVAIGGELLGRRVEPGSALYLALEDGQRRGQDRLRAALAGRTMPRGRLEVRWSARRIGDGLEDDIARWLDDHADARVIAIDTLGKVRPRSDGRRNAYEVDVQDLARLQDLFRDRQVALVIVHHTRKDIGSDDFLTSVSGTYGISGSADTIIVIRRKRLEAFGKLLVTGRDVADAEIPVRFDGHTWHLAPESLPEASFERLEILRVIQESGPIFPLAIAEQLELGRTSVQNMVTKLIDSGAVVRSTKGYTVAPSVLARAYTRSPYDPDDYGSNQSHRGHPRASGASVTGASVTDEMARIFEDVEGRPPVDEEMRAWT